MKGAGALKKTMAQVRIVGGIDDPALCMNGSLPSEFRITDPSNKVAEYTHVLPGSNAPPHN